MQPPLIVQNALIPPPPRKSKENCYHDSWSNPGQKIIAHDLRACTITAHEWVGGFLRTEMVGGVGMGGG